jgi:uncharacterized protein (TIGR04222 family)
MDGPTFLLLYTALIVAAVLGTRWFNRWRDVRHDQDLPPVPSPADPFELAWLRGGAHEAIRLAVYDLKQRGLLAAQMVGAGARAVVASGSPEGRVAPLAPIDRLVLRACAAPQNAAQLMRGSLPQQVEEACGHWRVRHEEAGLVIDASRKVQGWILVLAVAGGLGLLSVARIQHALAGGHPFGFLVVLTLIGLILVPALGRPPARLTARGRRYLARLRQALAPDPGRMPSVARAPEQVPETVAAGIPGTATATTPAWSAAAAVALLPIALHGTSAMPGDERQEMERLFPQAQNAAGSGGCGSGGSCGSASSDSGGGGGCGGCGGGGD